jgi:hypothetical protein
MKARLLSLLCFSLLTTLPSTLVSEEETEETEETEEAKEAEETETERVQATKASCMLWGIG